MPTSNEQPTTNITNPHNNDVLCGRGGVVNSHPGNEQYREIVERKKRIYLTARFKREKRLIASSIVQEIRSMDPPGRFLIKDPIKNNVWHEIGDEKAREKTSQALRENASNVRKEMEVEILEKRRLEMQEEGGGEESDVPLSAGDDSKPAAAAASTTSGFGGHMQQQQQQQQSALPQASWGFHPPPLQITHPAHHHHHHGAGQSHQPPPLHYPYSFSSSALHPPGGTQHLPPDQQQQQQQHVAAPFYRGPPPHSQYPQYIPNLQSHSQQQHHSQPIMLPPRVLSHNTTPTPAMHPSTLGFQSTINPPPIPAMHGEHHHSNIMGPPPTATTSNITTIPLAGPAPSSSTTTNNNTMRRSSLSSSRDSSPSDKHVQFHNDTMHHPSHRGTGSSSNVNDIPLVINSMTRNHQQQHPSSSIHSSVSSGTTSSSAAATLPNTTTTTIPGHDATSYPPSPTSNSNNNNNNTGSVLSHTTNLSQATPLAFLSRSTPPRHHVMSGDSTRSGSGSGRRKKRHTGTHAPSNSGKVQLDLSTLGSSVEVGAAMGGTTPRSSPPLAPTLPCGVMLTSPLRRSSAGLYRAAMPCTTAPPPPHSQAGSMYGTTHHLDSTPTSPVFSLDLDKMSLCGTENVSTMGGSIGGASLCHVFDDHEDNSSAGVGATLMDMTVSVGSHPSGATSSSNYSPQSGLGLNHHPASHAHQESRDSMNNPQSSSLYGDSESLIGVSSAIMDFSVGSVGMHSKEGQGYAGNIDNESFMGASSIVLGGMDMMSVSSNTHSKGGYAGSSQNSSSGSGSGSGGSLSRGSRRSGSPASIDKASLNLCEDGGRGALSG
ncbi:hypothetical protein ACHAWU_007187 [Discostella pseudostelligera]|uniref:DUF6824 domain-containing protein n=1 Tax=Discostella pseudostelligera TaxID=259834 RepID=A0ABD3M0G7_9STRA